MTPRAPKPLSLEELRREEARLARLLDLEEKALIRNHLKFDLIGIQGEKKRIQEIGKDSKILRRRIKKHEYGK